MSAIITFSQDEIAKATKFAEDVDTHNRRSVSSPEQARDNRIGKLGEIAFGIFLEEHGKKRLGDEDMFTVWSGTRRVDKKDFETADGETIDVKTASKSFHTRILVPKDQYENQQKHYYVGVRISEDEMTGEIMGYAIHGELELFERARYHPAYAIELNNLHPIDELLDLIPNVHPSL